MIMPPPGSHASMMPVEAKSSWVLSLGTVTALILSVC